MNLSDEQVLYLLHSYRIKHHTLESFLNDPNRAVDIRRQYFLHSLPSISSIPSDPYDYSNLHNKCCENVIGFIPIPLGIVGPITINSQSIHIPFATTEGCLISSLSRGCLATTLSGGIQSQLIAKGMTRGPVVETPSIFDALNVKKWIDDNFTDIVSVFESTSKYLKLLSIKCTPVGKYLYLRFKADTGNAMGMNMISKGTEQTLNYIVHHLPYVKLISVSGNYCTDKKSSSINWIDGRGHSVTAEATIKRDVIVKLLKTTPEKICNVNLYKNLVGSAMSGSIGGFNAHASNIVSGIFLATGQDPAQIVESSNCITLTELNNDNLYISVTMPSIEIGTIGGGTSLPAQSACLNLLNCSTQSNSSDHLALIIASTVLAGELSLLSALCSGDLVSSHLRLNRSPSSSSTHSKL